MVTHSSNLTENSHFAAKTAEERLSQSEASLHAFIDNPAMTIYSLDRDFRYLRFNDYLKQSLKQVYNIDIKCGDRIFDFLYKDNPSEAEEWRRVYTRALAGEPLQFVKEFVVGEFHSFFKFLVNPIREGENITGLTCVAIDISNERLAEIKQKKIARDLFARNQAMEQYAYIIAHNLRGPIANLLGIATLVEMNQISEKDKNEAVGYIFGSARRLDDVIQDLSDILQAKQQVSLHRESVNFEGVAREVITSMNSVVEQSGAHIITDFSETPGMITVKSYLHSIFYNLISNSIKYSKPGTTPVIRISSQKSQNGISLKFEDNGLGLNMNLHGNKVFELYKRFHPHVAEGKGIGLFMVKTQVEAIGGSISMQSEVGSGTTFIIEL